MPSSKPKTLPAAEARPPTTEPDSHVRMRRRSPAEREVDALVTQYIASEIGIEELVERLKAVTLSRVDRYLTEEEKGQLHDLVEYIDIDDLVARLRELGPRE
jgi:hypothetical protein